MFDITVSGGNKQSVEFNAVSGTIIKSCPSSIITRCHMTSELASKMLDVRHPHFTYDHTVTSIIVLQVMLCGEKELLIEYVEKVK